MFGEDMKKIRQEKGISQKYLAEQLQVSQANISSWEVGRTEPNIGTAVRIADILGVSVDELAGRDKPVDHTVTLSNGENVLIEMARKLSDKDRANLVVYAYRLLEGEAGN